jgi:hypothetical protein
MFRSSVRRFSSQTIFAIALAVAAPHLAAQQQDNNQNKHLDVQSSVGDLHMGDDADARKAGLPLYPGARLRHDDDKDKDKDSSTANLSLFTEAFGVKLIIAKYDSDDAPAKVIDFYRDKLKKYGKVLECHTRDHGGAHADIDSNDNDNDNDDDKSDKKPKPLKCEGDNNGPVTELKVGTENNQHAVAIEAKEGHSKDDHSGSIFTIVYVYARGKRGDI